MKLKHFIQPVLILIVGCLFTSCLFWESITNPEEYQKKLEKANRVPISSLSFSKQTLNLQVGGLDYIKITVSPMTAQRDVKLTWQYDKTIIECDTTSTWGVTIKGIQEGKTVLKAMYDGFEATCIITVTGFTEEYQQRMVEPYIYSNTTTLQIKPGIKEQVYVSLYNGNASDVNDFKWELDNPTVANSIVSIEPTSQYCVINAKDTGYARIKVTHPKALHPYYFGVYVYGDLTKVPFITTQNNILTFKEDDVAKTINVSLANPKQNSTNQFRYELISEDGSSDFPISLQHNNTSVAVINPLKQGFCTLRVTHNDAQYPLDILCRVVKIVQNAYIKPDKQVVTLKRDNTEVITSTIENYDQAYDETLFSYVLENYDVAEITSTVGNKVTLKGKANGSTKLIIRYESNDVVYDKEVLVIASEQITDAVDSSMYITTSQNYIRTKVGNESTEINISLRGGETGDEKDFTWEVKSESESGLDVVRLETVNGSAIHSRQASFNYIGGKAIITPNAEGTAVISVTHPKIVYPTEILVKVLPISAILEEPLYFTGESVIKMLNGTEATYDAELRGEAKTYTDDDDINFSIENTSFSVSSAGKTATIRSPQQGNGATQTYLTISHKKAENPKKVLVISADTQEELDTYQAMYSDKLYYNLEIDKTEILTVSEFGFEGTYDEEGNYTPFDFSAIQWTTNKPDIVELERTEYSPLSYRVTGKKAGVATVTARFNNHTVSFTVTVVPKGGLDVASPEVYFTTSQNVINISEPNKTAKANVSAINLSSFEYTNIEWDSTNTDIVEVIGNGITATLTAKAEGEAIINVRHEQSQNVLKIYVRVGSEYVFVDNGDKVIYINAPDTITMLKDDPMQKITAKLENYTGNNVQGFAFTIDKPEIATIENQSSDGLAFIKPRSAGCAEITITNTNTDITKKVLVMVGNSKEELASFVYLTTSTNVVAIAEGQRKTISASVRNSKDIVINGFTWESSAPHVIDVTNTDGTAVLTGNSIGSAVITVTNKACTYPLTIIAYCVDPNTASSSPYIQLNNSVLTLNVLSTGYQTIGAELVGGTEEDKQNFIWECSNSSIVSVYGQNGVGKIKAIGEGTAYVTVKHPKAMYPAQLLVIADRTRESDCYISVPQTNIMLKPTETNGQLITATLVNGSATDIYTFQWQVDNPSILDLIGSANSYRIIPKQAGNCNIIISHPKAKGYDQQIAVTVSEYEKFKFPQTNLTMTQGDVQFLTMEVPHTNVATHIEYSVMSKTGQSWTNPDITEEVVCTIQGTKNVAQITANQKGTTTVKAKLVASSTGIVQAESEMLVYVKEKPISEVNIASTKTIHTIQKGKSATLTATISGEGVTSTDVNNLLWVSNDSDIVQVTGLSTDGTIRGKQIYITALKSGEAIITCSHSKATSPLQFYVVVPGTAEKRITLNKTYMDLLKGGTGMQIKANIENSESTDDYANIEWTGGTDVYGTEIVRIMGKGQSPTLMPISVGETSIFATIYDSDGNQISRAETVIKVSATKSFVFENTRIKVEPFATRRIKYTVSPPNAIIDWQQIQQDDYYQYEVTEPDVNGVGYVDITGVKVGNGTLNGITDGNARGQLNITVSWDYYFDITAKDNAQSSRTFGISPTETVSYTYKVNPASALVETTNYNTDYYSIAQVAGENGTGTITITPKKECPNNLSITFEAKNPNDNNYRIGTITLTGTFKYNNITPKIGIISSDGKWSNYDTDNNILHIGDGETVKFKVEAREQNANVQISKVEFIKNGSTSSPIGNPVKNVAESDAQNKYAVYSINGGEDKIETMYEIVEAYVPTYKGQKVLNWDTDFMWYQDADSAKNLWSSKTVQYYCFGLIHKTISDKEVNYAGYDDNDVTILHQDWLILNTAGSKINNKQNYNTFWIESSSQAYWLKAYEDPMETNTSIYTSYWGKQLDNSLKGKVYTENQFKHIAWFYCPGTVDSTDKYEVKWSKNMINGAFGTKLSTNTYDYPINVEQGVVSEHVQVKTYPIKDTGTKGATLAGQLKVTILHNGKTEETTLPVYYEERMCSKSYKN